MDLIAYALERLNEGRPVPIYFAQDLTVSAVQEAAGVTGLGQPAGPIVPKIRVTHKPTGMIIHLPYPAEATPAQDTAVPAPVEPLPEDPAALNLTQLRALAKRLSLSAAGDRTALLARIAAHQEA